MKRFLTAAKVAMLGLLVLACVQQPLRAQEQQQPVMQNVFFNVVWGSAFGATLGVAAAVLAADDKSAPDDARSGAFSGATVGGLIGLGVALYLVYNGITFDPGSSSFGQLEGGAGYPALARLEPPPFTLLTSAQHPGKITGFSARLLHVKF